MRPICIDANVFISSTKGDEKYSSDSRRVIQTVALYGTYALDSIYLETALKHNAVFVTLDDVDFLARIKDRVEIEVYHPKDFP